MSQRVGLHIAQLGSQLGRLVRLVVEEGVGNAEDDPASRPRQAHDLPQPRWARRETRRRLHRCQHALALVGTS